MHIYLKNPNKLFLFQPFYFTLPSVHSKLDVYVALISYFNVVSILKLSTLLDGRITMMFYFSSQETWEVTLEVNTNFLSLTFSFLRVDGYLFLHSKIYKKHDIVLGLT